MAGGSHSVSVYKLVTRPYPPLFSVRVASKRVNGKIFPKFFRGGIEACDNVTKRAHPRERHNSVGDGVGIVLSSHSHGKRIANEYYCVNITSID